MPDDLAPSGPAQPVSPLPSNQMEKTLAYPASLPPPEAGPQPLATLGEYDLLRELGRGAQGVVYEARHRRLGRRVALKMFVGGVLSGDMTRMHREVEVTALLDHPNIVPVYGVGEHDGRPYFTMKLVEGASLADQLPRYTNDPRASAGLVACLARAVNHAHQRGVLHRDIKPSNVLVGEDGQPYVTDFGLARRIKGGQEFTQAGTVLGTPSYMAPEQAEGGQQATMASDVYGLGALLYALLTGRPPFKGEDLLDTLALVQHASPDSPSSLNPEVEPDLERVCLKCLEKEPERRYQNAEELARDLERYLRGEEVQARPSGMAERLLRWARRDPTRATMLVMGLFLLALVALVVRSYFEVRADQARYAHELARSAGERFELVGHAVRITAKEPELRQLLAAGPRGRGKVQKFLNRTRNGFNKWFTWSADEPLVNWFILDEAGTIIADSKADSKAVGGNFRRRDYARLLDGPGGDEADLSKVFLSYQDGMYKFCVCTRIHDGDKCVGVLAAALPVATRMLGLNMGDHPQGAAVVGPVDTTYPREGDEHGADRRWAVVLSSTCPKPGSETGWVRGEPALLLDRFADDESLREGRCLEGVTAYDAVRVGETRYVALIPHPLPWPVGLMSPRAWFFLFGVTVSAGALVWFLVRRPQSTQPSVEQTKEPGVAAASSPYR